MQGAIHAQRGDEAAQGGQGGGPGAVEAGISSEGQKEAIDLFGALPKATQPMHPNFAAFRDEAVKDLRGYMGFLKADWRKVHSTNVLERENREVRRRAVFLHEGEGKMEQSHSRDPTGRGGARAVRASGLPARFGNAERAFAPPSGSTTLSHKWASAVNLWRVSRTAPAKGPSAAAFHWP